MTAAHGHMRLASEFHADRWRVTLHIGKETGLHADEIFGVRVGAALDRRRDRADESVGQQNAEESPDQRRADEVAEYFWRFGDRSHRFYDAQNGGNDA